MGDIIQNQVFCKPPSAGKRGRISPIRQRTNVDQCFSFMIFSTPQPTTLLQLKTMGLTGTMYLTQPIRLRKWGFNILGRL